MKTRRRFPILTAAIALAFLPRSEAALLTDTAAYSPSLTIPDANSVGVSDTRIFTSAIASISEVRVSLEIASSVSSFAPAPPAGTFNGDYYVYLTHSSGFAVLLNRAGRTASSPLGYGDNGFLITFDDSPAGNDIHNYQLFSNPAGGQLSGTWGTDGRDVDPATVLDTSPRTTSLTNFNGLDPNGAWTIFVADYSPSGTGRLLSWQLQITGETVVAAVPVPEPGTALAGLLCGGLALIRRRSRRDSGAPLAVARA
jgi:hypothetical protein